METKPETKARNSPRTTRFERFTAKNERPEQKRKCFWGFFEEQENQKPKR